MHALSKFTPLMLSAALFLTACGPTGGTRINLDDPVDGQITQVDSNDLNAEQKVLAEKIRGLLEAQQYPEAAAGYMDLARMTQNEERHVYILEAARLWIKSGETQKAKDALYFLDTTKLPSNLRAGAILLNAQLLMNESRFQEALRVLPFTLDGFSPEESAKILELRGIANLQLGNIGPGLNDLIARDNYLSDTDALQANQRLIWINMVQNPGLIGQTEGFYDADPVLMGWVKLGAIGRTEWVEPERFAPRIQEWQAAYPSHPANRYLAGEILRLHNARTEYPRSVALLLPTKGRYARTSAAIRDGFMAAYFTQRDGSNRPDVRVYDTSNVNAVSDAYAAAVTDGAEFVVGPLRKESLAQLGNVPTLPIPVLALNRLQANGTSLPENLIQFGMPSEEEAREVARRASRDGKRYALAMVPKGGWGERMLIAFQREFELLGGVVVGQGQFNPKKSDYSKTLKKMLNLDKSRRRVSRLRSVTGRTISAEPQPRGDADFLFMAAHPKQARLIPEQLRFQRVEGLPIYATSHLYSGQPSTTRDRDLNGIIFGDMPFLVGQGKETQNTMQALSASFPRAYRRYSRLMALGHDAYRLIPLVKSGNDLLPWYMSGATGSLSQDQNKTVQRKLAWGHFVSGKPAALLDASAQPPAEPTDDVSVVDEANSL